MPSHIVLNGGMSPLHVDTTSVYFPFADGRLHYDCHACGAECCRGHGYELQAGAELEMHVATSASVRFFMDRCEALALRHYHVTNCRPGCFFLTDSKECRVHLERGYAAKPETCRLFPFNGLVRVGDYLVVAPHFGGFCPLEVVPPDRKSDCSSHEALLNSLTQTTINLHVPEVRHLELPPARFVTLERRIVQLSERHLVDESYGEFAAAQLLATHETVRSSASERLTVAEARANVERFSWSLGRILGPIPRVPAPAARSLISALVAATPALRSDLLFTTSYGFAESDVDEEHLPYALLTLEALAHLASHAGMQCVSYQSLVGLLSEFRKLVVLLARLNSVMMWRPTAMVRPGASANETPFPILCAIMRALLPDVQRQARMPMVDLLESVLREEHDLARILLLKSLARDLPGRLAPIGRYQRPAMLQRLRSPRSIVQQWLIAKLPDDVLQAIARKNQRNSGARVRAWSSR